MKKSIILIFIFISTYSFSQWDSEYDYFSVKFGATNTIFTPQPDTLLNHMLLSKNGQDHLRLFPDTGFNFNYSAGYFATFIYNHDLKSNNAGISLGVEYKNYGIKANYYSESLPTSYNLKETYRVSQVTIPVYIKYGKKFYDKQKYVYAGASYSYNLFLSKTEDVSYSEVNLNTQPEDYKEMLRKSNIAGIVGFNYMFFNFEANYVFGNFLSNNYEETFADGSIIKTFDGQPKGTLIIKTGLNVPINSWTTRKVYSAEMWLRRLLK